MTPFGDVLEHATHALAGAPAVGLGVLGDDELLTHLADVEQLGRQVDALRAAAAGEVEARSDRFLGPQGLSSRHQCATGALLVELVTRTTPAEACRRIRVGMATRAQLTLTGEVLPAEYPHVASALSAGTLNLDAAATIIRKLGEVTRAASPEIVREVEADLVEFAATHSAALVADVAEQRCAALDPDGVEPREKQQRMRRAFHLGRERAVDGMTPFSGLADPVNAALMRAALTERTAPSRQPRFVDPDDADVLLNADGKLDDQRTRAQRAFDVIFGLLVAGIRADSDTVGSLHGTATVSVVISARDLVAGTGAAWIDDTLSPVSTATTRDRLRRRHPAADRGCQGRDPLGGSPTALLHARAAASTGRQRRWMHLAPMHRATLLVSRSPCGRVGARRSHRRGQRGAALLVPPPSAALECVPTQDDRWLPRVARAHLARSRTTVEAGHQVPARARRLVVERPRFATRRGPDPCEGEDSPVGSPPAR